MKIIPEGNGADVKYYAQVGADSASKKPLGKLPGIPFSVQLLGGGYNHRGFLTIANTRYDYLDIRGTGYLKHIWLETRGNNNATDYVKKIEIWGSDDAPGETQCGYSGRVDVSEHRDKASIYLVFFVFSSNTNAHDGIIYCSYDGE